LNGYVFTSGGTMNRLNKFPDLERWLGNVPIVERVVISDRKKPGSKLARLPTLVVTIRLNRVSHMFRATKSKPSPD
jgi:hypothetical protein